MEFKDRLKELRANTSYMELAKAIGVSDVAVLKWEKGTSEPKACYIIALSKHFNVSTDYLLGLKEEDD